MTASQQTRTFAVRGWMIAGQTSLLATGSHGQFSRDRNSVDLRRGHTG